MAGTSVDRERAWAALAANVAVLPGLGSLLLGRRAGWLQAALAVCGFAVSVSWLALVLAGWWREGALPAGQVPRASLLAAGAALFGGAWIWALVTGLEALHSSRPSSRTHDGPRGSGAPSRPR